ncbi:hypothetical protein BC827DRAFT_1153585 [Russula dissimulans]|nr:hypothetical protein BC827DRAFT_1153585 [Russula dissimulans]
MSTASPLRKQRVVALALCWAWSIISACVGLNALIKSNQTQTRFRKEAPSGVILRFHLHDVYQPGVIITTISAVIALLATIFLALTQFYPERATGSLKIQAWLLTFFNLWLFATQIPYTVFVANHWAKIDAFLDGVQLPASTVQAAIAAAGETNEYSKLHFAVLLAIFPWITLLFTTILIFVLFAAARKRVQQEKTSQPTNSDDEKAGL